MNDIEKIFGTCISQSSERGDFEKCFKIINDNNLIEQYNEMDLVPIIYGRLQYFDIVHHDFEEKYMTVIQNEETRLSSLHSCAKRIIDILQENNIPILYLKNSAIGKIANLNLIENPMGDIDFLIRKENLESAREIIAEHGEIMYDHQFNDKIDEFEARFRFEKFIHRFEFQTRPVSGRWLSEEQEPSGEMLWSKIREISEAKEYTLSPEILLLTVCLHTAKHSFIRSPGFRLHTDVDRLVRYDQIDWNVFVALVAKFSVHTPVYISLFLSKEFLGTQIPNHVFDAISINRLKFSYLMHSLNKAGFVNPKNKKWNNFSYIIFNAMLYDNFSILIKHIFINREKAKQKYDLNENQSIMIFNIKRILNLTFNRRNH
jgi:hypothetical protein